MDRKQKKALYKRIKRAIGCKLLKKNTERQDTILADFEHILGTMGDFLLADDWKTEQEFIDSVNTFLELEHITFGYPYALRYSVGNMDAVSMAVSLHHNIIELKKEIGL